MVCQHSLFFSQPKFPAFKLAPLPPRGSRVATPWLRHTNHNTECPPPPLSNSVCFSAPFVFFVFDVCLFCRSMYCKKASLSQTMLSGSPTAETQTLPSPPGPATESRSLSFIRFFFLLGLMTRKCIRCWTDGIQLKRVQSILRHQRFLSLVTWGGGWVRPPPLRGCGG